MCVLLKYLKYKFYIFIVDTMQNVIEQSVLDNNWIPTADSAGATHRALSLTSLAVVFALPYLNSIFSYSLTPLFLTTSNIKMLQQSAR